MSLQYQSKQIASMKEESLNRSKFYDQLETSVIELERSNTQLSRKHEVDKKRIQRYARVEGDDERGRREMKSKVLN